jgi:hypothetical protein
MTSPSTLKWLLKNERQKGCERVTNQPGAKKQEEWLIMGATEGHGWRAFISKTCNYFFEVVLRRIMRRIDRNAWLSESSDKLVAVSTKLQDLRSMVFSRWLPIHN